MSHKKVLGTALIGNALEYYDFMLYSFFVSILSPLFFPAENSLNALFMGFGVFALGFLARPVGALVFGSIGDRWGRKKALSLSILLMALPTAAIGLLPNYSQIGIAAPLLLTLFRVLQGFSAGGEVNGSAIFALEHTKKSKRGFWGAILISSAGIGALAATGVGALFTSPWIAEWGWRIPFLLGGIIGLVGFYIRRNLEESPEFSQNSAPKSLPLFQVLKEAPKPFLQALAVGALIHVPFYMIVGYMNPVLQTKGLISKPEMMLINGGVTLMGVLLIPLMGYLADRFGLERIMGYSCKGLAVLSFIVFWVFNGAPVWAIILMQIALLGVSEGFIGPSNAYLNKLFPPQYRYTGVAVASCLGIAIFAGTTPLICASLSTWLDPNWGPGLYLFSLAMLALWALKSSTTEGEKELEIIPPFAEAHHH